MRSWIIWISFLLLAVTLGWFWILSHDLTITRVNPGVKAAAEQKSEAK